MDFLINRDVTYGVDDPLPNSNITYYYVESLHTIAPSSWYVIGRQVLMLGAPSGVEDPWWSINDGMTQLTDVM